MSTFDIAMNAQTLRAREHNNECRSCGYKLIVSRDVISNLGLRPASLECWNKDCKMRFKTVKEVQ